jgi:hypothetical protein
MYAKYFSAITSITRARRYGVPHFSLKNVLNIKVTTAHRYPPFVKQSLAASRPTLAWTD